MINLLTCLFKYYKKIILTVGIILLILTSGIIVRVSASTRTDAEINYSDKRFTNYTVVEGDTLWDIAESRIDYNYYDNINDYIIEIKKMNNLSSDNIYSGQNLLITYYVN